MALKIISKVDVTTDLDGKIRFFFHCPHCQQELWSTNEEVMEEDQCPYCNQSFAFDASVKSHWTTKVAEQEEKQRQKEEEKIRLAKHEEQVKAKLKQLEIEENKRREEEKAENKKRKAEEKAVREQKKAEDQKHRHEEKQVKAEEQKHKRIEAEFKAEEERNRRAEINRLADENRRRDDALKLEERQRSLKHEENSLGLISFIFYMVIGLGFVGGFLVLVNSRDGATADAALMVIISSLLSFLGLLVVNIFFRCLFVINSNLRAIREDLDYKSKDSVQDQ